MSAAPNTERFTDRVADYVRYRPDYPRALLEWLRTELGAAPQWHVADVGAGTDIATKMLLDAGYRVTAIEPNAAMRAAMIEQLGKMPGFDSVAGRADATGLPDASIDFITVAQAFHWFDPVEARREFRRILRPDGLVAVWWNSRRARGNAFVDGYEALLHRYGIDYARVAERHADDASMRAWFGTGLRGEAHFPHHQRLDFAGLRGRLLSSSYTPRAGQPGHTAMMQALHELFDATCVDGHIDMQYDTRVFAGDMP